jgi:hypothetical protein
VSGGFALFYPSQPRRSFCWVVCAREFVHYLLSEHNLSIGTEQEVRSTQLQQIDECIRINEQLGLRSPICSGQGAGKKVILLEIVDMRFPVSSTTVWPPNCTFLLSASWLHETPWLDPWCCLMQRSFR